MLSGRLIYSWPVLVQDRPHTVKHTANVIHCVERDLSCYLSIYTVDVRTGLALEQWLPAFHIDCNMQRTCKEARDTRSMIENKKACR